MFVHVTVANFAISHYMYYIQEFVAAAPGEKDDMLSWMCEKSASEFQKGNAIHSVLGLSKVRVQIFYLANMQIWFEANYTLNTTELNNYFISNESFSVDLGHSPVNYFSHLRYTRNIVSTELSSERNSDLQNLKKSTLLSMQQLNFVG